MARLNENENENENESSGGGRSGLFAGSRYNTYKILKQALNTGPGSAPGTLFSPKIPKFQQVGGWDPENRAWVYIEEFRRLRPRWFAELKKVATNTWPGWVKKDGYPDKSRLEPALLEIIDAAGEREDRFAEILHQRDADGCITYWMGALSIEPERHPNTYLLIRVARKLGEMVVMRLKEDIDAARPAQICPSIVPAFDSPRTASYPAGHALQSYLRSYLLLRVMPGMKAQSPKPQSWKGTPKKPETHKGLFALARRVSDNRVIAGVHFDIDNEAGFLIAQEIDRWFDKWLSGQVKNKFYDLVEAAKGEFSQWK